MIWYLVLFDWLLIAYLDWSLYTSRKRYKKIYNDFLEAMNENSKLKMSRDPIVQSSIRFLNKNRYGRGV